jgi:AraC family transcriptional regulator of adaptative response/methylated-DNA-[protein]-cysteine methyltransferase
MNAITINRMLTPIGEMCAGATDAGICLLDYADSRYLDRDIKLLAKCMQATVVEDISHYITELQVQLNEYFASQRKEFTLPLILQGTDFQRRVWEVLRTVPYGKTISYKQQAEIAGVSKAVRAVANANGNNRISIIIPCHRIIGSDGTLTGYGGGLWRKKWLLEFEEMNNE